MGAAEGRRPEGRWGPLRARSQEPARALRSDAVNTRPGAAASPQTGPRVPRSTGPWPQPLHHAPCQPSAQKAGRRASRYSLAAPSLPPCRPVSQTRRLAAPAGNGSSDRNRWPGEQPRLLAGHVQEGATGADAVFTVMTSGTPLGAPRCTRSGRHHAYSCQSADGGRPLANSKAQSPR